MSNARDDEVQVERTTIARATRRQLGLFQYSAAGKSVTAKHIMIALGFSVIGIVFLMTQGSPESLPSRAHTLVYSFLIPALGSDSAALSPKVGYNRAQDAKDTAAREKGEARAAVPKKLPGPMLISRPRNVQVPPGTFIQAVLITGASNGLVKAVLKDPIEVAGEVLVEPGTIAIGQGNSTEDRLYVHFTKLVSRDGQSVDSIQAEAADVSDKITGLKGSKISSHAWSLAAGIGLNFAAGLSEGFQENRGEQGAVVTMPSLKNALLHGTARASLEESKDLMNKVKNDKPVIAVESGKEIYLLFSESGK